MRIRLPVSPGAHCLLAGQLAFDMGVSCLNHALTCFVPASAISKFQAFEGKKVSIAGQIKIYKGKPEIVITEKNQIVETE